MDETRAVARAIAEFLLVRDESITDEERTDEERAESAKWIMDLLRPGSRFSVEGVECVVVPCEPTWPMQIAGRDAILAEDDDLDLSTDDSRAAYRAMLRSCEEKGSQSDGA